MTEYMQTTTDKVFDGVKSSGMRRKGLDEKSKLNSGTANKRDKCSMSHNLEETCCLRAAMVVHRRYVQKKPHTFDRDGQLCLW